MPFWPCSDAGSNTVATKRCTMPAVELRKANKARTVAAGCAVTTGPGCSSGGTGWPDSRSIQGDRTDVVEVDPTQHFTEPPPRFTEATLIKALEEHGIGRPSTYAATISTIVDRGYVKVVDGKVSVKATFEKAGIYTLRAFGHDGILRAPTDVTVTVDP